MNKILFIEDDHVIRQEYTKKLEKTWNITACENGTTGLKEILNKSLSYDCIILDLQMPDINGEKILEIINDTTEIYIPPIILFSAYFNDKLINRCILFNQVRCLLSKPTRPSTLSLILDATITGELHKLPLKLNNIDYQFEFIRGENGYFFIGNYERKISSLSMNSKEQNGSKFEIGEKLQLRENALKRYFQESVTIDNKYPDNEPLLVINRRWNSWYPSFFDVPGGAYAIVGQSKINELKEASENKISERPTAIIDPGFKFLSVFKETGISVSNINTCLITHNHPDHIGGIFEYLACRYTLGKQTRLICNPSTNDMFSNLAGELSVEKFEGEKSLLNYQLKNNETCQIFASEILTEHEEIGNRNTSRGVLLTSKFERNNSNQYKSIILGDTEYSNTNRAHFNNIIGLFNDPLLKVAILHIGCSQMKNKKGKHLYYNGLESILIDIERSRRFINDKLLILVSEWGLEHATAEQISFICPAIEKHFDYSSPIYDTIERLKGKLTMDKITLLPADIGLTIGLHTGEIYLNNVNDAIPPDEVVYAANEKGIVYSKKK